MGLLGFGKKKPSSQPASSWIDDEDEDDDESESISVYDATLIWMSNGKGEDYAFGYDEDELERALR